jgi:hypothetical protein
MPKGYGSRTVIEIWDRLKNLTVINGKDVGTLFDQEVASSMLALVWSFCTKRATLVSIAELRNPG